MNKAREDEIRSLFDGQGMLQTIDAKLISLEKGKVVIEAPIQPKTAQHHGYGHAGLSFTLGDTAAGFAAATLMEVGESVLSIEVKINLLAPATGKKLIAIGTVLREGRSILPVEAEIYAKTDESQILVAKLLGTMKRMRPRS